MDIGKMLEEAVELIRDVEDSTIYKSDADSISWPLIAIAKSLTAIAAMMNNNLHDGE